MQHGKRKQRPFTWAIVVLILLGAGVGGIVYKSAVRPTSEAQIRSSAVASQASTRANELGNSDPLREDCSENEEAVGCKDGLPVVKKSEKSCDREQKEYDEKVAFALNKLAKCAADSDCAYASFADQCRSYCARPVNKFALSQVVSDLKDVSDERCSGCAVPTFSCPGSSKQEVGCVEGFCVVVQVERAQL